MRLIALASLILSFSAAACPDLSGTYKACQSSRHSDSSPGMKITQRTLNGVVIYQMETENPYTGMNESEEMITDGMARIIDEGTEDNFLIKMSYHCEGENLQAQTIVEQTRDRSTYELKVMTNIRKQEGRIVMESDEHIVLEEDGTITTHRTPETIICE